MLDYPSVSYLIGDHTPSLSDPSVLTYLGQDTSPFFFQKVVKLVSVACTKHRAWRTKIGETAESCEGKTSVVPK